jgi:cold-inducible RNA-binding protein
MKLYVGNLSFRTTEEEVRELFEAIGPLDSVSLVRDRETGQSRGFGFVEMSDEHGRSACSTLDQKEFGGRRLTVNEAKPQERRTNGGGGGGGYGRQKREARW